MFSSIGGRIAFRHKHDKGHGNSAESQLKSWKSVEISRRLFMPQDSITFSRQHRGRPILEKQNSLFLEDNFRRRSVSLSPTRKSTKSHTSTPSPRQQRRGPLRLPSEETPKRESDERLPRTVQKVRNQASSSPKTKWTLARRFGLNVIQKKAIITSWQRLCDFRNPHSAVLLMETIFEDLSKTPNVRSMFLSSAFVNSMVLKEGGERKIQTVRDHAKFLSWFLTKVVENLVEDPKEMLDRMTELGLQHTHLSGFGMDGKMWEILGQKLVDHVVCQESVRHTPHAAKAWTVLLAGIIDMLSSGFLQSKRKQTVIPST